MSIMQRISEQKCQLCNLRQTIMAYTYDYTVSNNTDDRVSEFKIKMTFNNEAYIASAWNGALVIHQNVAGNKIISKLEKNKGTQFAPEIADIMLRLIEKGKVKV